MAWNWQLKDWPNFTWNKEKLVQAETLFIGNTGITIGISKHLSKTETENLSIEILSNSAMNTSEIEGEFLNRESVQSSIRKQLGLSYHPYKSSLSEAGISEMMVNLYKNISENLTQEILFSWHEMLFLGRKDITAIGQYRNHTDPMQIISGPSYAPKIHFEAPPSSSVTDQMGLFLKWFNETKPSGQNPLPPITRAGIAHIWFESIHPFEDGNGRIGRAISEMALAQGQTTPVFTSISTTLLRRQKDYYKELEFSSKDLDTTDWLIWFAMIVIESQESVASHIEFLIEKTRLLEKAKNLVNPRQEKVLLRLFKEGPEGFKGGLSAKNYADITGSAIATTTRDLADLTVKGFLYKTGYLKGTRYFLNIASQKI